MSAMREAFGQRCVQVEVHPTWAQCVQALLTCIAYVILLPSGQAQESSKFGKAHDQLKRLVGTWEVESELGSGTMVYKMELDGLWLVSDFDGEFGGVKIEGKGLDTYDVATKKYRSIWVDSLSTQPRVMEGALDKDNKVITLAGEGPFQEGIKGKYKSITEIKDDDTLVFSLFVVEKDGKEQSLVTITYKRKK